MTNLRWLWALALCGACYQTKPGLPEGQAPQPHLQVQPGTPTLPPPMQQPPSRPDEEPAPAPIDSPDAGPAPVPDDDADAGTTPEPHTVPDFGALRGDITRIDAGGDHACALDSGGRLYCWGANFYGQAGRPLSVNGCASSPCVAPPTEIAAPDPNDPWQQVSAGHTHTCAITQRGRAYCWGSNHYGELGNGTAASNYDDASPSPTAVVMDVAQTFTAIAAGEAHTCAIGGGVIYCWGTHTDGELGSALAPDLCDDSPCAITPQALDTNDDWTSIVAAGQITCGMRGSAIYCWGSSAEQQRHPDCWQSTCNASEVRAVNDDTDWREVSTWSSRTCAIKLDGSLWCWGSNETFTETHSEPTHVPLPMPATHVAPAEDHTCITADRSLYCWGMDTTGQIGDGPTAPTVCDGFDCAHTPQLIAHGVSALSAGYFFTCATSERGGVVCWGNNRYGQLGTVSDALCDVGLGEPTDACTRAPQALNF